VEDQRRNAPTKTNFSVQKESCWQNMIQNITKINEHKETPEKHAARQPNLMRGEVKNDQGGSVTKKR
jgi:hypothetical protein